MSEHACPDCGAVHTEKRTTLKQRVEALEAKVAALEARAPQWTWTNYPVSGPTMIYSGTGDDVSLMDS